MKFESRGKNCEKLKKPRSMLTKSIEWCPPNSIWNVIIVIMYLSHFKKHNTIICMNIKSPMGTFSVAAWSSRKRITLKDMYYGICSHNYSSIFFVHFKTFFSTVIILPFLYNMFCFHWRCSICDRECTSTISLRAHFRVHEWSQRGKPFTCTDCNRSYSTKNKMNLHMKMMHGIGKTLDRIDILNMSFNWNIFSF